MGHLLDAGERAIKQGVPCSRKSPSRITRSPMWRGRASSTKKHLASSLVRFNWWVEYDLPGGGCLALTNFTKERPSDSAGGTIAFEVEDLDRLMTDLKGKGVTFKSDVIHSPVCRMAVCLDSEGNSILLHQLKPK
jgi:hypothetical protein